MSISDVYDVIYDISIFAQLCTMFNHLQLGKGVPGNKETIIGRAQFKTPELPFMLAGNNNSIAKLKYDRFGRPLYTWYQILVLLLCATNKKRFVILLQ